MDYSGWELYPKDKKQLQALFPVISSELNSLINKAQVGSQYLYTQALNKNCNNCNYYDQALGLISGGASIPRLLTMVSSDLKFQDTLNDSINNIMLWQEKNLGGSKEIFTKLKEQNNSADFTTQESKDRFYKKLNIQEIKAGFLIPDSEKENLENLKNDADYLGGSFEDNITKDDHHAYIKRFRLDNIPKNYKKYLNKPDAKYYEVYPDSYLLSSSDDELARKALWKLNANIGYPQNEIILKDLISKRDTIAKTLGFSSFAHLDITGQMAGTPEEVDRFLSKITKEAQEKVQSELEAILKYKPENLKLVKDKIKPWDLLYLKNNYKEKALNCSNTWMSEYFPFDTTLKGLVDFLEEFFNIKFSIIKDAKFWDNKARAFEITYQDEPRGYLIFDLYSRKNKYPYTLEKPIMPSTINNSNNWVKGVTVVISSLLSPWQNNIPLLDLRDISTLAHEIGHGLHTLLGAQNLICQSGTALERDFVEMPGQMLERWSLNSNILKQLSNNYKTGKKFTDDEIALIQKTRDFDEAERTLEQVTYARTSLEFFLEGKNKDINKIYERIATETRPYLLFDKQDHGYASFDHLISYGSKYYSYLWSDRFAQKIYDKLAKEAQSKGSIKNIGQNYLETVIRPGGSKDPWLLLSSFFNVPLEKIKNYF